MSSSAVRGAILVAVAALLGFLILRGAADQEQVPLSTVTSAAPTPTAAATPTPDAVIVNDGTQDVTTDQARPNSQVSVLVANGTDVSGQALRLTMTLRNQGFNTREPKNANLQPTSVIYYRPGFAAEALVVREILGQSTPIAPMPEPDPIVGDGIDLVPVDVFVLVGADALSTS